MTVPPQEALKLQRPLPDGALRIVARGEKEDQAAAQPSSEGAELRDGGWETTAATPARPVQTAVVHATLSGGDTTQALVRANLVTRLRNAVFVAAQG
jgi:hypothetical protein